MARFDNIKNVKEQEKANPNDIYEEQLKKAYNSSVKAKEAEQVIERIVVEQPTNSLTLEATKRKRDVKIVKSTRIDKSTVNKVEEIILAYKFFNPDSTLSFNEVINVALEEWASKKEHIDLRNKVDNVKKMLK